MAIRCSTGTIYLNITTAKCWKCNSDMKVSWGTTMYDDGGCGTFYGPNAFNEKEIELAKENGVVIKRVHSKTMNEEYDANMCPNCGAFIGDFFIHEYLNSEEIRIEVDRFDLYKETNLTLEYYNEKANEFTEGTQNVDFTSIQNEFINYLKEGSHILDLGCGSGRDSKAFINKGFKVTAVDGSEKLCKISSKYIGQKVICKKFQDYNPNKTFDGIWACASLLHLKEDDIRRVMFNLSRKLNKDGCFYASFKYGEFSGERNGRYFTDMTESKFTKIIEGIPSLKIIEEKLTDDVRSDKNGEKWLNIFMIKS